MNFVARVISYFHPVILERRMGIHLPYIDVDIKKGEYRLNGRKVTYSFGPLHDSFKEAFLQHQLHEITMDKVLILGFGSGSIARLLQHDLQLQCSITGVEIDSEILELGQKYFHTEGYQNTRIHCADAFEFVHYDTQTYDLIVIDLFIERRVPKAFMKADFIRQVKHRLNPGGFVFFNRINDNIFQQEETTELVRTMIKEWQGDVKLLNFQKNGMDNFIMVYQYLRAEQLVDNEEAVGCQKEDEAFQLM